MTTREGRIELLLRIRLVATTREQSAVLEVCEVYQVVVELDLRAVREVRLERSATTSGRVFRTWTALLCRGLDNRVRILSQREYNLNKS